MTSPVIVIAPYDEGWPGEFDRIAARLRGALGPAALAVDHVGSTSVPGLAAKDVIDVQVTVADLDDPRIEAGFASLGARRTGITVDHLPPGGGDPAAWEKRYFRAPAGWRRTHLHVRRAGSPNHRYALLFRDYLRADVDAAEAYARVKTALAALHPDDVEAYYAVKDPACDLVMSAGERWAAATGWTAAPG